MEPQMYNRLFYKTVRCALPPDELPGYAVLHQYASDEGYYGKTHLELIDMHHAVRESGDFGARFIALALELVLSARNGMDL
jgi:hypothetical protein